jgi:DNA-directed RNA polymerase subunit RPC12/RpoP
MAEKEKLKCPKCKSIISNTGKLVLYKKYKCAKCESIYFLIRIPKDMYVSRS